MSFLRSSLKKTPQLSGKKNSDQNQSSIPNYWTPESSFDQIFVRKLIEQLKNTFGKHYDYHRRDIAADEVDYLNVEDPDVFSHRAWELEYQRKQEKRRNQPVRSKKKSHDMEL